MKKTLKISRKVMGLFLTAGTLIFASQNTQAQAKPKGQPWPAPASAVSVKNPVKSDALTIKDGKNLFIKNCTSCHGDGGKGDGTKAKNLDISCGDFTQPEVTKMSDGELYWKITEGRKPMPTFAKKLTDTERWSVVNYMRTLK